MPFTAQEGKTPLQLAESHVLQRAANASARHEHADVLRTLRKVMGIASGSSSSSAANAAAPAPEPAGPAVADDDDPPMTYTPDQIQAMARELQRLFPVRKAGGSKF